MAGVVALGMVAGIHPPEVSAEEVTASAPVTTQAKAGQYVPLTPVRLLNGGTLPAKGSLTLSPASLASVPDSGVSAVTLTITASAAVEPGVNLAVYPSGVTTPAKVDLIAGVNETHTKSTVTRLGANQQITVLNNGSAATKVSVDVHGYYTAAGEPAADTLVPTTITRILDPQTIAAGGTLLYSPLGAGDGLIPEEDVSAVILNVTTRAAGSGYVTTYPSGATRPGTRSISYAQEIPTEKFHYSVTTAKVGDDGKVAFYNGGAASVELWADVEGYYQTPAGTAAGSTFVPLDGGRLLTNSAVTSAAALDITPGGNFGIPDSGVSALAFSMTVRAKDAVGSGYLRAVPRDEDSGPTAMLHYSAGFRTSNHAAVPLGTDGQISLLNAATDPDAAGVAEVLLDVDGYFSAASAPSAPGSVTSTPHDGGVQIRWAAPTADGGARITHYTITSSPGELTETAAADEQEVIMRALTPGVSYTFEVVAGNGAGESAPSVPSAPISLAWDTADGSDDSMQVTSTDLEDVPADLTGAAAPVESVDRDVESMSLTPEAIANLDPKVNAGVAEYGDSDPVPASEQPTADGSAPSLTAEQQSLTAPKPAAAKYEGGPTFAKCAGIKGADPLFGKIISRKQHCFRTKLHFGNNSGSVKASVELVSAWSGSGGTRNFKTVTGFKNFRSTGYYSTYSGDYDIRLRITCGGCNHDFRGWGAWVRLSQWMDDSTEVYPELSYGRSGDGMRKSVVTIEWEMRHRVSGQNLRRYTIGPRSTVRCDSAKYGMKWKGCIVNQAVPRLNLQTNDSRTAESVAFLNRARLRPDDTYPRKAEGRKVLVGFDSATSPKPLHRLYPTAGRKATRIAKNGCVQEGGFKAGDHCDEYPFAATRENALAAKDTKNYAGSYVKGTHNSAVGTALALMYGYDRILDGEAFYVRITAG
jgi:hypothetical protein